MSMKPNTLLIDNQATGIVKFAGLETPIAWNQAVDATNYPVKVVPAFYQVRKGEFLPADGKTNTERDKHFNLVLVNKYRKDGDDAFECISTVTGQYGTLDTPSIYLAFREQLKTMEQPHSLVKLYVSGNGGAQKLVVSMDNMQSMTDVPDNLTMFVELDTSVDGSKAHTIKMTAHNKTGNTSVSVYGGEYNLSARHTTTIQERTVNFIPHINKLVQNWNDTIIPMMKIIFNEKFNRPAALELLAKMGDESGIGKRHMEDIVALYESETVFTNDTTDSLYRVYVTLNHYIEEELEARPELQERFRTGLTRSLEKQVKRIKK